MAIPEAYINNVGSLTKFLDAIRAAGVPDRVTFEFLKTLGFKSSNDRPIISVMKGIGFLDENGSPTATYKAYRDPSKGPKVLAKALKASYADLFLANTKAHELATEKLRGIIAAKVSKGEGVVKLIAATFKALAKAADFSEVEVDLDPYDTTPEIDPPPTPRSNAAELSNVPPRIDTGRPPVLTAFHYNIQIHLPTSTDISVYNAIFKSIRDNLS